jgi:hypothetical protein
VVVAKVELCGDFGEELLLGGWEVAHGSPGYL